MRGSRSFVLVLLSVFVCGLMMVPSSAVSAIPESYMIEGVPLYQQIDAKGCGAVSLQMVFDYYGPFIDQKEIYNAARSGGTALPDMARAAQFSSLSTTAGSRWPEATVTGYTGRSLGYAGFFYASTEPWLDELKAILAEGYPVIVLVWWLPGWESDDHYRVIVGYDDVEGVVLINDGWCREFKVDMDYQGSTQQNANPNAWDTDFTPMKMTYADFLDTWRCPTTPWGVPDLAYGGVLVAPWEVTLSAPSSVLPDEKFKVTAEVKYPCMAPFGSDPFPVFGATGLQFALDVGDGLCVCQEPDTSAITEFRAGETISLTWTLHAKDMTGEFEIDLAASGLVSGSLGVWKDYPAYDYTDMIGGSGTTTVMVP